MNEYRYQQQQDEIVYDVKNKCNMYKEVIERELNKNTFDNQLTILSGPLKGKYVIETESTDKYYIIGKNYKNYIKVYFVKNKKEQNYNVKSIQIDSYKEINDNHAVVTKSEANYLNREHQISNIKYSVTDIIKSRSMFLSKEIARKINKSYSFVLNSFGMICNSSFSQSKSKYDFSTKRGIIDYLCSIKNETLIDEMLEFIKTKSKTLENALNDLGEDITDDYFMNSHTRF